MEFKVGDKVRIIKDSFFGFNYHTGDTGYIESIEKSYYTKENVIHMLMDKDGGRQWVRVEEAAYYIERLVEEKDLEECAMEKEGKKENNATTAIKAAMNVLGIKKGSKIDLYDEYGERIGYSPYKFDGKKLVDNEGDSSETEMGRLIFGRYTFKIVEEGQFIPENGEEYWYVDEDGDVAYVVCNEDEVDAARVAFGNAFETESIARDNVKNVLDKVHKVFNEEDENKEDC